MLSLDFKYYYDYIIRGDTSHLHKPKLCIFKNSCQDSRTRPRALNIFYYNSSASIWHAIRNSWLFTLLDCWKIQSCRKAWNQQRPYVWSISEFIAKGRETAKHWQRPLSCLCVFVFKLYLNQSTERETCFMRTRKFAAKYIYLLA